MNRFVIQCLTALTMLTSCIAGYAGNIPEELVINKARALVIEGVIARGNVLPLGARMIEMSHDQSGQPIDLVISSPGGDVLTGFIFLNIMEQVKANGTEIRCFVPTMAASMAFQILVHCSERHVLDRAFLLWHRVRVSLGGGLFSNGVIMTAPLAHDLMVDLAATDRVIFAELEEAIDMPLKELRYHFEHETMHVGRNLGDSCPDFITSHKSIPGLLELMLDKKVPRNQAVDSRNAFQPGTIVYITNKQQQVGRSI